jgi:crotonobetainyl-CoA:carnitine CoA-transferase CaiB-like acyl-CoA transferase
MTTEGVFSGVRVLELAQYVFVPGAGVMLADQGAEVIHVETPGAGDPYRTLRAETAARSGLQTSPWNRITAARRASRSI